MGWGGSEEHPRQSDCAVREVLKELTASVAGLQFDYLGRG